MNWKTPVRGRARTFGEQVYQKKGVGGVRAEAAGGFAGVRETALPRLNAALNAGLSLNDAALCALTALMARTEDTNAVRRGGEAGAKAMREKAQMLDSRMTTAIAAGKAQEVLDDFRHELTLWDQELTRQRISPGGCADLLALALLMRFCREDADSSAAQRNDGVLKSALCARCSGFLTASFPALVVCP